MKVIKPQAPFERLKEASPSGEVALRRAIILQAIIDASAMYSSNETKKMSQEAASWLFNNSQEFELVCHEADLDPKYVRRTARSMINLHHDAHRKNVRDLQRQIHRQKPVNQPCKLQTKSVWLKIR